MCRLCCSHCRLPFAYFAYPILLAVYKLQDLFIREVLRSAHFQRTISSNDQGNRFAARAANTVGLYELG